jgi:hypothetical protein
MADRLDNIPRSRLSFRTDHGGTFGDATKGFS